MSRKTLIDELKEGDEVEFTYCGDVSEMHGKRVRGRIRMRPHILWAGGAVVADGYQVKDVMKVETTEGTRED